VVRELADSLFAVLFPAPCSLCGQDLLEAGLLGICPACWESLEPWSGPACACCGLPFASDQVLNSNQRLCGTCRQEEFQFDGVRSYGIYGGHLRAAILQLKFRRRERLGEKLGELLASLWGWIEETSEGQLPLLIPVPLHRSRELERGFNQAELLARGLTRKLTKLREGYAVPAVTGCLRRTRATAPQTGLSVQARHDNVRGGFSAAGAEQLRGGVVVLVDDVMTTGATLSACASALKRAGARSVLGLTLARATPLFPDGGSDAPDPAVDAIRPERA